MTKQEVVSVLEHYNKWRRDHYGEVKAVNVKTLGIALDEAIKYLKDE